MINVLPTANFKYTEITFDLQGTHNADLYHESQTVFITKFYVLKDVYYKSGKFESKEF